MTDSFGYTVYGLRIKSAFALPELVRADVIGEHDVRIEMGSIPAGPDPAVEFLVEDQHAFLNIHGVGRYCVSGGYRIVIQPEPDAAMRNVRAYLLGSAMGLLLHQRGDLPLHANAVEIKGRSIAFMGHSGAGKSTLAAAFHDRGYPVIADDVCVVRFDTGGRALACPGIPRLRLWEDALTATGRTSDDYPLTHAFESFRKFDVPVQESGAEAVPLAAIYHLARGDSLDFRRLNGSELAETIFANTYRGGYIRQAGDPRAHWASAVKLVASTPVFEMARLWDSNRIPDDLPRIIRHAEEIIGLIA